MARDVTQADARIRGRKILVVEDDYHQACEIQRLLEAAGAVVTGLASDEASALAMIEEGGTSIVLLDVDLGDGPSFNIANRLQALDIPFIFLTGFGLLHLPDSYSDRPLIVKPANLREVIETIAGIVD